MAALTPANRLVCRVCVDTGLRVGDVVSLRTAQLARQFWITEQKTGKRRRVNLTDGLLCCGTGGVLCRQKYFLFAMRAAGCAQYLRAEVELFTISAV